MVAPRTAQNTTNVLLFSVFSRVRETTPYPNHPPISSSLRANQSTATPSQRWTCLVSSNHQSKANIIGYISHAPSTQTLTLAYSSLPEVEDLIDLLAYPEDPEQPLVPLPDYILANRTIDEMPRIHSSYLYPLEDFGLPGLLSLLDVLEDNAPEPSPKGLMRYIRSAPAPEHPIKRVDIIGHGLGAAMGLLVSLALEEMTNAISIHTTLFGLPRVGDQAFARLVDDSHSDRLDIKRVTSFKDSITHFPETHLGLVHPSKGEIWVSSDPRTAYSCRAVEGENEACGGSVELGKSSLMDHQGPYGGVWVGSQSCQSRS